MKIVQPILYIAIFLLIALVFYSYWAQVNLDLLIKIDAAVAMTALLTRMIIIYKIREK